MRSRGRNAGDAAGLVERSARGRLGWAAVIVLVAVGLRVPGLFSDFWLDEIWSWALARRVSSPLEVFTAIHVDNNNHLNTLWLWMWGPAAPEWAYRLHSLLAGVAAVVFAMWSGERLAAVESGARERHPGMAGWWAGLLLATCAVYAVYSSEARGYATAIAAALGSQLLIGRAMRLGSVAGWFGFAAVSVLGFLSHLSYLTVLLSQAVWWGIELVFVRRSAAEARRLLVWGMIGFAIPALFVGWLYVIDLRLTRVGGGPEFDPSRVIYDTLVEPFGTLSPAVKPAGAIATVVLLVVGLIAASGRRSKEWIGLASLCVVAPVVLFGLAPSGLVYPRHFLVPLALLIPVCGLGLARLARGPRASTVMFSGLLVLWLVGNGAALAGFYRDGRGQYRAAMWDMLAASPEGPIIVGSDHDFRNGMLIGHQRERSAALARIDYRVQGRWPAEGVDWIILHDLEPQPRLPGAVTAGEKRYRLVKTYRFSGPVGWHWGVYRRADLGN